MNLMQGAAAILAIGFDLEKRKRGALEAACVVVETEAKDVIGTYRYGWPQLAASTQDERARLGYPPNEPLLRTGDMRDSIQHTVPSLEAGYVGSNEDKAVWQELGTSRGIPPRSFLAQAAMHKGQEVADKIAEVLFSGAGAMPKALP